jgi:hypothetical protein
MGFEMLRDSDRCDAIRKGLSPRDTRVLRPRLQKLESPRLVSNGL